MILCKWDSYIQYPIWSCQTVKDNQSNVKQTSSTPFIIPTMLTQHIKEHGDEHNGVQTFIYT